MSQRGQLDKKSLEWLPFMSLGSVLVMMCAVVGFQPLTSEGISFVFGVCPPSSGGGGVWSFLEYWDDDANFIENDLYKGSFDDGVMVWRMLTEVRINVYEPVAWFFKAVVYRVCGEEASPVGFRLASLALHAANAVLLMYVSDRLLSIRWGGDPDPDRCPSSGSRRLGCVLSSMIFVLQPVHVEVVGWPSAQSYTLMGFFAILSVLFYLGQWSDGGGDGRFRWSSSPSRICLLCVPCYLLSALSKSAAVMLPVVFPAIDILLYDRPPSHGGGLSLCRRLAGYVGGKLVLGVAGLVMVAVTVYSNDTEGGSDPETDIVFLPLQPRLLKAISVAVFYLGKAVWPTGLRPHYALHVDEFKLWPVDPLQAHVGDPHTTPHPWRLVPWPEHYEEGFDHWSRRHSASALGDTGGAGAGWGAVVPGDVLLSTALFAALTLYALHDVAATAIGIARTHRLRAAGKANPRASPLAVGWLSYAALIMPAAGLVQHGMVQRGGDRYSYMPLMAAVPFIAALFARAFDRPSAMMAAGCEVAQPQGERRRQQQHRAAISVAPLAPILLVCLALGAITQRQISIWRDDQSMLFAGLRADPSDWRILDTYAEYLLERGNHFAGHRALQATFENAPRRGAKGVLNTGKSLQLLGDTDQACAVFFAAIDAYPDNAHLRNDVAICQLRLGQRKKAAANFERAARDARAEEYREKIEFNLQKLHEWEARDLSGGYEGTLMW